MLMLRKIVFFLVLFVGLSLFAQQDYLVSSYVRGNFYNRGRVATESLRASDDLIFLNVHPNKDGTLSFENPRAFQGKGVTTWEGLIKSVRAKVKGTKTKIRLGASSGEWKAMVAESVNFDVKNMQSVITSLFNQTISAIKSIKVSSNSYSDNRNISIRGDSRDILNALQNRVGLAVSYGNYN